jgi:hypothetical protein
MRLLATFKGWDDASASTFHGIWIILSEFYQSLLRFGPTCSLDGIVSACRFYCDVEGHFMDDAVDSRSAVLDDT